jgi:hypothetical protein
MVASLSPPPNSTKPTTQTTLGLFLQVPFYFLIITLALIMNHVLEWFFIWEGWTRIHLFTSVPIHQWKSSWSSPRNFSLYIEWWLHLGWTFDSFQKIILNWFFSKDGLNFDNIKPVYLDSRPWIKFDCVQGMVQLWAVYVHSSTPFKGKKRVVW